MIRRVSCHDASSTKESNRSVSSTDHASRIMRFAEDRATRNSSGNSVSTLTATTYDAINIDTVRWDVGRGMELGCLDCNSRAHRLSSQWGSAKKVEGER
jgi:hypothetical protein